MSAVPNSVPVVPSGALERHLTPEELGEVWGLSADTVRRLFEREAGVLIIDRTRGRRRYRTMRIPESVALRVHRQMTNPITGPARRIS